MRNARERKRKTETNVIKEPQRETKTNKRSKEEQRETGRIGGKKHIDPQLQSHI